MLTALNKKNNFIVILGALFMEYHVENDGKESLFAIAFGSCFLTIFGLIAYMLAYVIALASMKYIVINLLILDRSYYKWARFISPLIGLPIFYYSFGFSGFQGKSKLFNFLFPKQWIRRLGIGVGISQAILTMIPYFLLDHDTKENWFIEPGVWQFFCIAGTLTILMAVAMFSSQNRLKYVESNYEQFNKILK